MKAFLKKVLAFGLGSMFLLSPLQAAEVEVLHWWTSGGEAAALNVLKEDLQSKGIGWKDMPVAGGGGTQAMTVLRSRVTSGTAPTAVQMLGFDILDWAAEGVLADLNRIARQGNWDAVVPLALQKFSKYDGQWISVPVNVHSTNWVWANKAVFEKVGVTVPRNWDEFVAVTKKIKAAGYTPIAHGGQAWQDATVFDSILLSVGGYDFYKKTMVDLNLKALGSAKMVQVFDRMRVITGLLDPNFSGRDWNLASAMVINEKAAMQIMGDWAKGEFIKAGKVPGKDFMCFRFPETQGIVTFNSDQFAMFRVGSADTKSQMEMAKSVISPVFQSAFNVVKGSAPARTDVPNSDFDACGKKGMTDLASANMNGTLIGSMAHGHANPAGIKNAMYDVITNHFNTKQSSRAAVKALVAAVETAM
ncbi:MAG: carbohydrate ABC transporter substrate-binding protein [Deltaproteobacteria bacterium]|jgi:glucose/mannose transport system substrate-binding protein|nr:carbohydrate ABC transporter substrate-binding protein [Deltaproteobacteria bacterium]